MVVIVLITVIVFFNPWWIGFKTIRAGVSAITGYTSDEVRAVTGSILTDLFLGHGDFAVAVDGTPVLDATERSHMVDVRTLIVFLGTLFASAVALLAVLMAAERRRAWIWLAIGRGASALVVSGVAIGVAVLFFFDAAFLLFHRVFFSQGNFLFDPRTQRLTQLFPEQFWSETSSALVLVGFALAVTVALVARRQATRSAG